MKSSPKVEEISPDTDIFVETTPVESTSEKWLRAKKLMGDSLHQFDGKNSAFSENNASLKVQGVLKSLARKISTQQSGQDSVGSGKPQGVEVAEIGGSSREKAAHSTDKVKADPPQKLFSAGSVWQIALRPNIEKQSVPIKSASRVQEIVESLARVRSNQEVEIIMNGLEGKVTLPELKQTLSELGKAKQWITALQLFDWMHENALYRPDETVYQLMFLLLAKAKKMEMVQGLLERMKKAGMQPGVVEYTAIIAGYVKNGSLHPALLVLEKMRDLKIKPGISAYNVLLDGCVRVPSGLEVALNLIEKMKEDQIEADSLTYSNLIFLYGRKWRHQEVVAMFLEMRSKGYCPDKVAGNAVLNSYNRLSDNRGMLEAYQWMSAQNSEWDLSTYHILFNGLAHSSRIRELPKYYSLMRKGSLIPDGMTCSILLSAYAKSQQWGALESLLHDMKALGVKADLTIYNTLICVYGKAGCWEGLELITGFVRDKQKNGLALDVLTYNSLLSVYGKGGRLDEVMRWFSDMKIRGVKPDVKTFTTLVTAYSKLHHYDGVEEVLELLKREGYKPDLVFYQSVLFTLGRGGKYEEAWKIIEDMHEGGYLISAEVYNSLCAIYGRGNAQEARKLFLHMVEHDIQPNPATFKALIDIHGQKSLFEECIRIYEESVTYIGRDYSVLTAILNACCNLRCIDRGERLLQDCKNLTASQLLSTHNYLIRGYGRTGEWTKAEEVLKRLKLAKIEPNLQTHVFLLEVYTRVGQVAKGAELAAYLQKENISGNIRAYNTILQFYLQQKNAKPAMEIYDMLRKKGPKPDHNTHAIMVDAYIEDGVLHEGFLDFLHDVEKDHLIFKNSFFRAVLGAIPKCKKHEDAMLIVSALELVGIPNEIIALFEPSGVQHAEDATLLWERVSNLLRLMDREGLNIDLQRAFHSALIDALWFFGWEAKALRLISISVDMGIYGNVYNWNSEEWCLDLHTASVAASQLLLLTWISHLQEARRGKVKFSKQMKIILAKDWQMRTQENILQRKAVEAQLKDLNAPFVYAENNGILQANRRDVMKWLSNENLSTFLFLTS